MRPSLLMSDVLRILYRIWQIYKKPVDELVTLLGLDIPLAPEVSLAGITSDSVVLYWKPPDQQYASLTHSIHVNGIKGRHSTRRNVSQSLELFAQWAK